MCEIKKFNDYAATIILVLAVVAALTVLGFYAFSRNFMKVNHEEKVVCVIATDSTGVVTPESYALAESVKEAFEIQEHAIEDKYKYIIEQKERTQDYLTWGGLIITVILSIFGFFGYKSLSSIEDRIKKSVQEHATGEAVIKAREYAEKELESYEKRTTENLDEQVKNKADNLGNIIDVKFGKSKKEILDEATETAKTSVNSEYNRTIAPKESEIQANTENIGKLQQELAELKYELAELETKNKQLEARVNGYKPSSPGSPNNTDSTFKRGTRKDPNPYK